MPEEVLYHPSYGEVVRITTPEDLSTREREDILVAGIELAKMTLRNADIFRPEDIALGVIERPTSQAPIVEDPLRLGIRPRGTFFDSEEDEHTRIRRGEM